jgi:hypothetical protein
MDGTNNTQLDELRLRLDALVRQYAHPVERRIGYGNLRREYSTWGEGDTATTNIALVYETPGGSTAQINIAYDHGSGDFTYLERGLESKVVSRDVDEVMATVLAEVQGIPEKRLQTLRRQIERWHDQGKSRSEVFGEMNKLLQSEFIGGKITNQELRLGIHHAIQLRHEGEPGR